MVFCSAVEQNASSILKFPRAVVVRSFPRKKKTSSEVPMQAPNSGVRQIKTLDLKPPVTEPEGEVQKNNGASRNRKRKLDTVGLQNSAYFKLRATVRDLRPYFVEVFRAQEFQDCKAVDDIRKRKLFDLEMKTLLDLYRQLQVETASRVKEKPDIVGKSMCPNMLGKAVDKPYHPEKIHGPIKTPIADNIPDMPGSVTLRIRGIEQQLQHLQEIKGTYIVGGSPIGRNFLMYPGAKPLYYGVAKETWLSRMKCRSEFLGNSLSICFQKKT